MGNTSRAVLTDQTHSLPSIHSPQGPLLLTPKLAEIHVRIMRTDLIQYCVHQSRSAISLQLNNLFKIGVQLLCCFLDGLFSLWSFLGEAICDVFRL